MEQKFWEPCREVVEELGLSLYHLKYRENSGLLQVMIQDPKTQGASIENCVDIDRALTPLIERGPWVPEKLTLEVSSPGLERPLRRLEHFQQSLGERVALVLYRALEGQYRIEGTLKSVAEDEVCLEAEGREILVAVSNIKKAQRQFVA